MSFQILSALSCGKVTAPFRNRGTWSGDNIFWEMFCTCTSFKTAAAVNSRSGHIDTSRCIINDHLNVFFTIMTWSQSRKSILHLLLCSWLRFLWQEFRSPLLCLLLWRALEVEEWWKQFLRILLHRNNVFLAPWKKTSRRQTVSAKSRAWMWGKSRTLPQRHREWKHLRRHFWQWWFQVSEMKAGGETQQYPVSHNRRERRLYRDLKGGQCEMSAVTLAAILLWLSSSVISSNAGNGTDSPSCGEDSGGWWSGSCSPASQNDITVREQQQQTMQNV